MNLLKTELLEKINSMITKEELEQSERRLTSSRQSAFKRIGQPLSKRRRR
jgi:hypothetical protein